MHEKLHSHGNRLKRRRRKRWFCLFRPNFTEKKHCFFGQNFTENTVFLQAKFHRKNKLKRCLCFSRTTGCILPAPNITRPTIPVEILDIRVSRFKGKPNWSCKWAWKWKKCGNIFLCQLHSLVLSILPQNEVLFCFKFGYTSGGVNTLYLHACQVKATVGGSGLCCCTCVTYFER